MKENETQRSTRKIGTMDPLLLFCWWRCNSTAAVQLNTSASIVHPSYTNFGGTLENSPRPLCSGACSSRQNDVRQAADDGVEPVDASQDLWVRGHDVSEVRFGVNGSRGFGRVLARLAAGGRSSCL